MPFCKLQEVRKGQVAQRVGVIGEEHLFASQIFLGSFESLSDVGMKAAINKSDVPSVEVLLEKLQVLIGHR